MENVSASWLNFVRILQTYLTFNKYNMTQKYSVKLSVNGTSYRLGATKEFEVMDYINFPRFMCL